MPAPEKHATPVATAPPDDEEQLRAERVRLVRLCTRLTGDAHAGEDLAQETLLAAYRQMETLRHPERRWSWLASTARHLSVDWVRRRGRERRYLASFAHSTATGDAPVLAPSADEPAEDFDVTLELERAELALLLDRAMALLPPETRRVLLERFIEEVPQAQVALRLGLTEGAVEARVQRGKLALRRILASNLREEAIAHGLLAPEVDDWQPTRIWCPNCGQRRLWGRFVGPGRELQLECRDCLGVAGARPLGRSRLYDSGRPELFAGVKGFKPALNRQMEDLYTTMTRWVNAGRPQTRCRRCGVHAIRDVYLVDITRIHMSTAYCPHCRLMFGYTSAKAVAMSQPEGRRFWREHPRLRSVPDQMVEASGRPAIVTRLVSLTNSAEYAVVLDRETLQVIKVHSAPTTAGPNAADDPSDAHGC